MRREKDSLRGSSQDSPKEESQGDDGNGKVKVDVPGRTSLHERERRA